MKGKKNAYTTDHKDKMLLRLCRILFQWSVVYTSFRLTTIPSDFLYMQENKTIQSIDLQGNNIRPEGAKSIAKALEVP